VANSVVNCATVFAAGNVEATATLFALVTVAAASTIVVQGAITVAGGTVTGSVYHDTNGYSTLSYVRLA